MAQESISSGGSGYKFMGTQGRLVRNAGMAGELSVDRVIRQMRFVSSAAMTGHTEGFATRRVIPRHTGVGERMMAGAGLMYEAMRHFVRR